MNIKNSIVFITGANGGVGRAFVVDLLKRGASKVYAGTRTGKFADSELGLDPRVVAIRLDVTKTADILAAVNAAADTTLLINNAGVANFAGALFANNLEGARNEMEVNYFGTLAMVRAFGSTLGGNGGGAVINMLSILALLSLPAAATYSASKAATLSLTRSLRAELKSQSTQLIGVVASQMETALGAPLPEPRMRPSEVVADTLDALEAGLNDEVIAGGLTRAMYAQFQTDPGAVQAMLLNLLAPRGEH